MDIFGPNLVRCERTIPIVSSTSTTTSLTILSNPSPNYSPSSSSTSYNPIYYDTFDNAVLLLTRPLRALEEACSSSKTRPIDFVLLPPELDVNGELDEFLNDEAIDKLTILAKALYDCQIVSKSSLPSHYSLRSTTSSPPDPNQPPSLDSLPLLSWFYSSVVLPPRLSPLLSTCSPPTSNPNPTVTVHLPPSTTLTPTTLSPLPPTASYTLLHSPTTPVLSSTFPNVNPPCVYPPLPPSSAALLPLFQAAGTTHFVGSRTSPFSHHVYLLRRSVSSTLNVPANSHTYSCSSLSPFPAFTSACPSTPPLIGFWHIGSSRASTGVHNALFSGIRSSIALQQYLQLSHSLIINTSSIRYISTVPLTEEVEYILSMDPRFTHLQPTLPMDPDEEYFEFPTLDSLHNHCLADKDATVFYFHTKTDDYEREMMGEILFNMCAGCEGICGPRFRSDEESSWCHFKGNFWLAPCSHVRTLNPPYSPLFLAERYEADRLWRLSDRNDAKSPQHGWPHDIIPYGRFMAEYWVTNDRGIRPSHQVGYLEYKKHRKGGCLVARDEICTAEFD